MTRGRAIPYSLEEVQFLSEHKELPRKELTRQFNQTFHRSCTVDQIKSKCLREGFLTGRTGCLVKGNVPWNKGKKGYMGANATSFKKGNRPHNTHPIGTSVVFQGFICIKVAEPNIWKFRSKMVWEAHHGAIPKGFVVWHKNGKSNDDRLENLTLRHRSELLRINQLRHKTAPDELKQSIDLLGRLQARTFKRIF